MSLIDKFSKFLIVKFTENVFSCTNPNPIVKDAADLSENRLWQSFDLNPVESVVLDDLLVVGSGETADNEGFSTE